MKVKTQIGIDRVILSPIVFILNKLVRLAGMIVRPKHNLEQDFNTIAVCKFKGMGSIIQATPLLQNLRHQYPNAKIVFVSTKSNSALLQLFPFVDQTLLLDDSSFWKLLSTSPAFIFRLIQLRISLFIDLEIYSNFSSIVVALSMAKNRIGYYLRSGHYKLGIYTHMLYFNNRISVSEVYLQMFRITGKTVSTHSLYDFSKNKIQPNTTLTHFGLTDKKFIVINPNASDLRIERRWPAQHFVDLIQQLKERYTAYEIVLIGSKSEKDYTSTFQTQSTSPVLNLAGKTNLQQLIDLILGCDLFITNDTGPMHIGFALQTKTIALFGPCHPSQYGNQINGKVLYQPLYCSPCVHEFQIPPCQGDNQCMKKIKVNGVLDAVTEVIDVNFVFSESKFETDYFGNSQSEVLGIVSRPGAEM